MDGIINVEPHVKPVKWNTVGKTLDVLDQTLLPETEVVFNCNTTQQIWDAIKKLAIRGAPLIGIAASYALVVAVAHEYRGDGDAKDIAAFIQEKAAYLISCRPTAVNLAWATNRMKNHALQYIQQHSTIDKDTLVDILEKEAIQIHEEDRRMCLAMGNYMYKLLKPLNVTGVLNHCNAGALATGGVGTSVAVEYILHALGHKFTAYCDETRPLLQGARLTSYELSQAGIDAVVITDNMAAHVMKQGLIQAVVVGADRIARNGDAANKIVAVNAKYHNIPFFVVAPYSTFDLIVASGDDIVIEQRKEDEVRSVGRVPPGARVLNPAFDVTPASLITAIVTDRGVVSPVTEENVRKMMS